MPAFAVPLSLEAVCVIMLSDFITSGDEDGEEKTVSAPLWKQAEPGTPRNALGGAWKALRYAGVGLCVCVTCFYDDGQAGGGLRVEPVVTKGGIVKAGGGLRVKLVAALSHVGIPLDTLLLGLCPRWAIGPWRSRWTA
jgi:hypothetical protein